MDTKTIFATLLFTLPWLVALYFVNLFMEAMIIGDPCLYHSEKTSALFDFFYDLPTWNGCHPAPTKLNLILTVFIPALFLGFRSANRFYKPKKV
jgi:hypothetical protein